MKRKRNLILIVAAIIVIVAMIVFLQFNRNRIQSVKFNGYETSEEAIKKYLDAFVKKDSESVMSSYCPKGMEKAAADRTEGGGRRGQCADDRTLQQQLL